MVSLVYHNFYNKDIVVKKGWKKKGLLYFWDLLESPSV